MAGGPDYREVILNGLETAGEFACGGRLTSKAPELEVQVWPAVERCTHCIFQFMLLLAAPLLP